MKNFKYALPVLIALTGCAKEKFEDLTLSEALKYKTCSTASTTLTAGRMASRSASSCTGAQTINSVASGAWHSATTWQGGMIPTPCDHVIIKNDVVYADQAGSPGYTHYGDLTINPTGSFEFREDGALIIEGIDGDNRTNLVTNARFFVTGDLVLEHVHMVANPPAQVRVFKDLVMKDSSTINNETLACNGFVVSDDVVLYDGSVGIGNHVIHSTHAQIIVGAGPGQTPNASEQPGTLTLHDAAIPYIFGVAGTSASQIYAVPPHGPKGYTLASTCAALPVHFTSVSAKWNSDRSVKVSWSTGMEMDSKSFVVEMTTPCSSTIIIASIPIPAAGTSSGNLNYSIDIPVSEGGTYLFRVVEIDTDGSKNYSNWVAAKVGK